MTFRPPRPALAAAALAVAVATLAGCGTGAPSPSDGTSTVRVVTTTTILADLVAQVGGSRVTVDSLVPKGGEVHTFDPTPSDVRRLSDADLVVINGLGLDDWLADLVAGAGTTAPVVELAEDLDGVTYLAGGEDEGEDEGEGEAGTGAGAPDDHAGEGLNPHLWLNVAYARLYAERIAGALAEADPANATAYRDGMTGYGAVLDELDTTVRARMAAIPEASRTVISFHDAFPYFAAAYGLTIDGTVVDAPGQDPSAGELSDLIAAIRARNVTAILAEIQFSDDLVRTIADETGAVVVSNLYSDTLGDAPQDTYVGIMTWNVEQIASALAGS
jgi:ABC-type Zn uptake system ZnuABC Zn-binding protein ZnuA